MNHDCKLTGGSQLANNVFDLQFLAHEHVLDRILYKGDRLRDSRKHQQLEHLEEDHRGVALAVDLHHFLVVVCCEAVEHFIEEDRCASQEIKDEVAEQEGSNVLPGYL